MKPGDLWVHLEAYLALKKALGFPLGARERLLRDFVAFAESNDARGTINAQVARIAAAAHAFNVIGVAG